MLKINLVKLICQTVQWLVHLGVGHNIVFTNQSQEMRKGKMCTKNESSIGPNMHAHIMRPAQTAYTHSDTGLEAYCCHRLQIKCMNAMSYDLHINVFINVCYFFIKSTFISPLINTPSAMLLHQPNKY